MHAFKAMLVPIPHDINRLGTQVRREMRGRSDAVLVGLLPAPSEFPRFSTP
jgi:hypothetical protein